MKLEKGDSRPEQVLYHACYFMGEGADRQIAAYPLAVSSDYRKILEFLDDQPEADKGYIEERIRRTVYLIKK